MPGSASKKNCNFRVRSVSQFLRIAYISANHSFLPLPGVLPMVVQFRSVDSQRLRRLFTKHRPPPFPFPPLEPKLNSDSWHEIRRNSVDERKSLVLKKRFWEITSKEISIRRKRDFCKRRHMDGLPASTLFRRFLDDCPSLIMATCTTIKAAIGDIPYRRQIPLPSFILRFDFIVSFLVQTSLPIFPHSTQCQELASFYSTFYSPLLIHAFEQHQLIFRSIYIYFVSTFKRRRYNNNAPFMKCLSLI